MQGPLLCCNCVHVGVELETCAEALLSAADVTATPTVTNAKMVSLNAIPPRIPNSWQRRQQQRLQAKERPSQPQCRSQVACGLASQASLLFRVRNNEVAAPQSLRRLVQRKVQCDSGVRKLKMRECTGNGLIVSCRPGADATLADGKMYTM